MTAAVIVQARMASTRLPGKVMLQLGDRVVLDHVLTRCKAVAGADVVCCAIPDGDDCGPIVDVAKALGVAVFRGSESDVLGRYRDAAVMLGVDTILRVTSDCPLIDPILCNKVLERVKSGKVDFACNNMPPSWPHGLDCEAVSFEWLEYAFQNAVKNFEREHVMPWVRTHSDVSKSNIPGPGEGIEDYRWTIDNERDLEFLRALWERLPNDGPKSWSYTVPLAIMQAEPELVKINAGQDRLEGLKKSIRES